MKPRRARKGTPSLIILVLIMALTAGAAQTRTTLLYLGIEYCPSWIKHSPSTLSALCRARGLEVPPGDAVGLFVLEVNQQGNEDGLSPGDLIVRINGKLIDSQIALDVARSRLSLDEQIDLAIRRFIAVRGSIKKEWRAIKVRHQALTPDVAVRGHRMRMLEKRPLGTPISDPKAISAVMLNVVKFGLTTYEDGTIAVRTNGEFIKSVVFLSEKKEKEAVKVMRALTPQDLVVLDDLLVSTEWGWLVNLGRTNGEWLTELRVLMELSE